MNSVIKPPMRKRRLALQVGRMEALRKFMLELLIKRTGRRVRRKNYPLLVTLPSDAIGREIIVSGLYEEHLLLAVFDGVLASKSEDFLKSTVLDVGANIGNHSLFFSRRFGKVVSFEPNPPVAKIFEANVALNDISNATLVTVGLSSEEKDLIFAPNVSGNLGGSRFLEASSVIEGRTRLLPVRIGDLELERLGIRGTVTLIKLDVEGHELEALRGLEQTINRDSPFILFESNQTVGPGGGEEIAQWLYARGYHYLYSVGPKWNLPRFIRLRIPKIAGITGLLFSLVYGENYFLEQIVRLEDRIYPLLLASRNSL